MATENPPVVVEPRAPAATPAVESGTEAPTGAGSLPDEILQIPAMQAVFAGQPAAVSAPLEAFSKRPEAKLIADNRDALMRAGMGLYRSLGGDLGVIFNQLRLNGEQLKQADQAGKLLEIAPPFDEVNQAIAASGEANPVLSAQVPAGAAGAPVPSPSQFGSAVRGPAPMPASSQKSLTNARIKNQMLGKPSEGPKPGAGRLLNSILRPVL